MKVSVAILILVCFGISPVFAADAPLKVISPVISFSNDEQTVTIRYDKGEWTFRRPVVSLCAYDNGGGKYGDPARNVDDYNCYFPGKPNERIHPGQHEVLSDPLFVDAKKGDYRLREVSPCRGKGLPSKGRKVDLGAFEAYGE